MKPLRKKRIFISYAREDKDAALRIKNFFEVNGVATWFDQLDILPGVLWRPWTRNAIQTCDYFLALLSETSVAKREGFVWVEFNLALKKQRDFPDQRLFIFPVRIDAAATPEEFKGYNAVRLSDEALESIVRTIEGDQYSPVSRRWKLFVWGALVCGILFTAIMTISNMQRERLIFKTTIRDTAGHPIQNAYAYILGPNDDTVIKSSPSGTNGQVYFELDTTDKILATVWYYHPQYVRISKMYTLMAHETHRYVDLTPLDTLKFPDSSEQSEKRLPPPSKKLFLLTGLDLTADEKQKIKNSTGYSFSYDDTAERILIDYDHTYDESLIAEKFIFRGSKVFLLYDSAKINTGIYFPPDGGLARTKEDLDRDNAAAFAQLLEVNRSVIVNSLIKCLNDF